ncbi:MAG: glycosyltransferase family 4 protein [Acidimicrobiaceae bacterium]|nr:glycosyltransferase family 4 protein [Acidimicrobiaceae bacterium]
MTATRTRRILSIQNVTDGGGSERALIRMIRQLRAEGWECHVAVGSQPRLAGEYAAAGALVHIVPMKRITTSGRFGRWPRYLAAWPVSVARLVRLGRRLDVDVVHTNSLHAWYGWAAAAALRRPHVWHAREIVVQSALALRVERFLTRHFADRVVAVSEAVAEQFAGEPVTVIFDEPDPTEFRPSLAGRFRGRVGIADDAPLVGSVGRIDTWKGVDTLLKAVPVIRSGRPEVEVLVAGPPVIGKEAYARGLADQAETLGVHWLGPRDDVAELMADLDVYVMASTEPEPFGLGLVEALASGTPAVATDAGGPIEILSPVPEESARLVPIGDAWDLAEAVLALLPDSTSSGTRALRPPLRRAEPGRFGELFASVLAASEGSEGSEGRRRGRL